MPSVPALDSKTTAKVPFGHDEQPGELAVRRPAVPHGADESSPAVWLSRSKTVTSVAPARRLAVLDFVSRRSGQGTLRVPPELTSDRVWGGVVRVRPLTRRRGRARP